MNDPNPHAAPVATAPVQQYAPPPVAPGAMHVRHDLAAGRRQLGEERNPWTVFLLAVVTFGIYSLVWYHKVNKEVAAYEPSIKVNPGVAVLALVFGWLTLGIATIISLLNTGGRVQQAQRAAGIEAGCSGVTFLLISCLGFGPVYLQGQLNKVWAAERARGGVAA